MSNKDKKKDKKKNDKKATPDPAPPGKTETSVETPPTGEKGHNYPYSKFIKQPHEMGSSSEGTIQALNKDIKALGAYVGVLISGDSKAQKGGEPLGNKYFLDTGTTCTDSMNQKQSRYIFINNVPDGLPFISSAMGQPMKGFRGLVPGVLNDLSYINPSEIFSSFSQSTDCQKVTMDTRDVDNIKGTESQYVLNDDIAKYPAWWFSDCKNPVTKEECTSDKKNKNKKKKKEGMYVNDSTLLIYYAIGIVAILFLYKSIKK
jgi:hypothetical protein